VTLLEQAGGGSGAEGDGGSGGDQTAAPSGGDRIKVQRQAARGLEEDGEGGYRLERTAQLTSRQLAGGFDLDGSVPVSCSLEESYRRRLKELSPDTRRLLSLAAADPTGDPLLLSRAAERLRIRQAEKALSRLEP
jgi:hypothetical protein